MRDRKPDYVFLFLLGAVLLVGFVMLTSATGPVAIQKFKDAYWYVRHQALYGLLPGVVLFIVMSRIDYRLWRRLAFPLLGVSVALLLLVFIPGLGADWGTSKSWINIGGYSLQPAELVKLTFLLYLAAWLEGRGEHGVRDVSTGLVPFLMALGIIAVLIMLQPDLGSLLVIGSMAFIVYFLAGAPWHHLAGIGMMGLAGLAILIKAAPYRAARFMTFLHPELDPQGVGYHINQAFLAIGSGGLFGLGLGHSRQKFNYLPEVAGDSIFAIMAEELGFVVTLAVLALVVAFLWRGIAIARNAPDAYGRLVASGIIGWVFVQTIFNIGSMVGFLPLTGLPLPFMSYGGTALMTLLAAMGLILNISRQSAPSRS
jgi:cell division protein FtsW